MLFDNETQELLTMVREFVDKEVIPTVGDYERNNEFPEKLLDIACDMGLNQLCIPAEYGGPGLTNVQAFAIAEEIARGDIGIGTTLIANALASYPILIAGSDEQKRYWFDVMKKKKYAAFCLTEPNAGSDASGVKTTAVEDGDDYIINGTKCFISNGPIAGIYSVIAVTRKGAGIMGLSVFMVERDRPGVSIGKEEDKMGMRLSCTSEVIFDNVRVPKSHLVGKKNRGFKYTMETLDHSRAGVGAFGVGIAQRVVEEATKYAKERRQFGQPVANFQMVEQMLADMEIQTQSARQMYLHASALMDAGLPFTMESAIAKTMGTDTGMKCAVDGVQVCGGYGYMKEYPMEKLMRDAKILQIYEGTNQIQRTVIASHVKKKYSKNDAPKAAPTTAPTKKEPAPSMVIPASVTQTEEKEGGKALNLLVCIKQVPDTTQIKIDPVKHTLIREGVPAIVNTFDTYALETALRLKDAVGGKVTVITMGIPKAKDALRECLAAGADAAYLLTDRAFGGSDTLATSKILSTAISYLEEKEGKPFDVIFCGKQAIDGDTGQVGPEISEHLGRPLISYAIEVSMEGDVFKCKRESDEGYDFFTVGSGCVITVNKTAYDLRFPNFATKRFAMNAEIPELTSAEVVVDESERGLKGSPTKVVKTYTPHHEKNGMKIENEEPVAAAKKLTTLLSDAGLL